MTDKVTAWAMVLSCIVLAAVSWIAVRTIQSLRYATDRVIHTQAVLVELEGVKFALKQAESAGRGYLLTGKETFREEFNLSQRTSEAGVEKLRLLTNDNPAQIKRLVDLKPKIDRRLQFIADAMRLRDGRGPSEAIESKLTEGLAAMEQVMLSIDELIGHENGLLNLRMERADGRLLWVYSAIGGGFFLSVFLSGWPILRLRRELQEREKARQQLVASSERIQDLYNEAPCGYFSVLDDRIVSVNDTLLHWLGMTRRDSQNLTFSGLCVRAQREEIAAWLRAPSTESRARQEREVELLGAQGRQMPVWLTAVRAHDGSGEWRITAVDMTERKRAEALVARARDHAESIVNTVRQPLLVLTDDLRVTSTNRAFHSAFGTSDAEIVGRNFTEIIDGQWAVPELLRALEDVVPKHASIENFEISLNLPKKGRRVLELNARKLFRPGNDTTMTLLAIEDITVRQRMAEVHGQFRALFESLPGRYLVLTPDFQIVAASDAYLAMTMTKRTDVIGRNIFEVFPDNPDDVNGSGSANLRASFNRVLQTGTADTMPIQRYDIPRSDGMFEERHWSPVNSPVFSANKKIEYIIHRAEDVTEFVLANQLTQLRERETAHPWSVQLEAEMLSHSRELVVANQQLHALNEELEAFSYSVSHDLRAPLRHISGFSEMLTNHAAATLDDKGRRYLKTIGDSAARMGVLIDDLLMFSRMGRSEMGRQNVSLSEIVAATVEGLKSEIGNRAVRWEIGDLPPVEGDVPMLRQVFANLLSNAVKYSRHQAEARIVISAQPEKAGMVELRVRDNGAGFDMKYAPKLFGVFQRLHSASEFEGTGVGLAIVRRIVQRHGGRIWAESAVGAGATFYLTLPVARSGSTTI
jgi:PAS domain S-box-containing protein